MSIVTTERADAPAGPPKLTPAELRAAQQHTLNSPRLRYSLLARALFTTMNLAYGRAGTIVKFAMLEFIARVPYQAWERAGYLILARHRRRSALARRVFERIVQTRAEQDNEQWHLLILEDLVQRQGLRQSFLLHRLAPWLIALFYYHVSWLLLLIRPDWSYRLNADFEDHAEREYMAFVADNPGLETQRDPGSYAAEYGRFASLALPSDRPRRTHAQARQPRQHEGPGPRSEGVHGRRLIWAPEGRIQRPGHGQRLTAVLPTRGRPRFATATR